MIRNPTWVCCLDGLDRVGTKPALIFIYAPHYLNLRFDSAPLLGPASQLLAPSVPEVPSRGLGSIPSLFDEG